MNICSIIKMYRIKNGLTLEELAEGIISVSYLSKIENSKVIPNNEIIKLLCIKLGIRDIQKTETEEKGFCKEWFSKIIILHNYHNHEEVEKIKEIRKNTNDEELKILIDLHFIHYYLYRKEIASAKRLILSLQPISDTFNNNQKYYWNKFLGNYYYTINNHKK